MKNIRNWFSTVEGNLVIAWEDVIYGFFLCLTTMVLIMLLRWLLISVERDREKKHRAAMRRQALLKRSYEKRR